MIHVIVTRAGRDLDDITELYYKRNSVPLDQAVAKDTYRDYKTSLLSLPENEDQFRSSFNISEFSVTIQ